VRPRHRAALIVARHLPGAAAAGEAANVRPVRRVRLTIVVDSDVYGGAEAYAAQLLRRLPTQFETTLLATPDVPAQLRAAADGRIAVFGRPRGKADLRRLVGAGRALRATRPNLVHVNMATVGNNRHLIGLCGLLRLRAVATLHIVAELGSAVQMRILGRAYRRLAFLIAVSEETRRQLCDELGLPEQLVRVVANGVDERPPVTPRDGRLCVGGVGRLTAQKGFDVLIEAVRRLAAEDVPIEAVVVGDGPDRGALSAAARELPVELRGFVDDVPAFHAELGAFCLPSRWEGLPFALLEAMMSGLPCVASDVGDVRRALEGAGAVVPPGEPDALAAALRELAESAELRRERGAAARQRALERYTVEAMVAETARVYNAALAA
jgi:glycosyltransferase involved in cell wall biosynthesis